MRTPTKIRAVIAEIIKVNASLPFTKIVSIIEEEVKKLNLYEIAQWRLIYKKHRNNGEMSCEVTGKRISYWKDEKEVEFSLNPTYNYDDVAKEYPKRIKDIPINTEEEILIYNEIVNENRSN